MAPKKPISPWARGGPLAGLLLALAGGCAAPPAAVTTNLNLAAEAAPGDHPVLDEASQRALLGGQESAEVVAAMREALAGKQPLHPPGRAASGLRWTDVEVAVEEAVKEVEAAILKTEREEDGVFFRFQIRTIEGYPGEVVVRRVDRPKVYELDAWIGRFPHEARNVERAQKLRAEIDKQMRRLGAQRWFPEGTEP